MFKDYASIAFYITEQLELKLKLPLFTGFVVNEAVEPGLLPVLGFWG
jgi:hypothetical protein